MLLLWRLLLRHVGSSTIWSLTLHDHIRLLSGLLSLLLLVHRDHLQGAEDFLFELSPLDNRIVQLNLRQVDEHASDLRCLHVADELLDVLVDGVTDDVLLGLAIWCLLVLGGGEHVSDLNLIRPGILTIKEHLILTIVLAASDG